MTGERVRWGVVGCGWLVRDHLSPAFAEAEAADVVALCDPDPDALAAVAARHPGAVATADLDTLLATPGLEGVYVATPNDAHRGVVEAAAAAGRAVLCEKPMATTVADAEAMVAACRAAGVRYGTAFDQRFHAAHRRVRDLVAQGALGTVTQVRVVYQCWLDPAWRADALMRENWRVDPARAGGGALVDLAPHGLDLATVLLGEPLVDVTALAQRRVHDAPVDDGAVVVARSAGGVLVTLAVAYNTPEAYPRRRLEVVGTGALAVATDTMGQTAGGTLRVTDAATGTTRAEPLVDDRSPFTLQVEAFSRALRGRTDEFPFTPEGDLHTMRLLDRARRTGAPPA